MNRHERRKAAAQSRQSEARQGKGRDGVATEGQSTGKGFEDFPPDYYEHIEKMAAKACQWHDEHPDADLKWIEQKDDGVILTGDLDVAARYLADSPDAFALLAWVDEQTERKGSLFQMLWALRRCGGLPMPDGSYYGVETTREKAVEA
jgi:hypothetical protein